MSFTQEYFKEAIRILQEIDTEAVESVAATIANVRRQNGRIFFIGVGGGAGHASHAVCDFRKIAGIESYSPSDNASELTARINDEGWDTVYSTWLRCSRLSECDMVFVFSVGGGDLQQNISANLVRALQYARQVGCRICGIVGRDGGFTAKVADTCIVVPVVNPAMITPHTEGFQAVLWHLLVSHPAIKSAETKWESVVAVSV